MTIGYEGLKPEDFLDKLQENNVSFLNTKAKKAKTLYATVYELTDCKTNPNETKSAFVL